MFSFQKPSVYQTPKCFVTYGTMSYPDPAQLPTKAKPWSTLLSQDYVHKIDLILPEALLQVVKEKILDDTARIPSYQRVVMTLGQVLEGDFFTQYIKIGNIMMLSEGKVGTDNVFSIKDGKLIMYLERETYERAGLVGKPHGAKGARGSKPRWIVEYDLRTPSPDPVAQHYPTKYTSNPVVIRDMTMRVPPLGLPSAILDNQNQQVLDEYATEVYEWLSLVRLDSPRVKLGDDIDPYLSTYAIPGAPSEASEDRLCKISWQGFIPPSWAATTLAELIKALPPKAWFSFSTTPFTRVVVGYGADFTILRPPSSPGEFVLWEIKGHD
ncbi:ribonuclease P 40kDa subunit, partial [Nemania sp. NC0429]